MRRKLAHGRGYLCKKKPPGGAASDLFNDTGGSIQLGTGGDVGIHQQQVQLLLALLLMDGGEQHTAGVDAHHGAGRQVHDGDGRLASTHRESRYSFSIYCPAYHLCLQLVHSYCLPILEEAKPQAITDMERLKAPMRRTWLFVPQIGQQGSFASLAFSCSAFLYSSVC